MPFTVITNPAVGETLKVGTFGIPVIDNLNFLNDQVTGAASGQILNGSFETGTGTDTAPTAWDLVIASGNTTDFETSAANTRHGRQAFSMTTPGAVVGGVTLTSTDFIPIAEERSVSLRWLMRSSIATTLNTVSIRYFDEAESFISADAVYSDSATNPTVWETRTGASSAPATAKLFKVEIVGVNNATAATTYWDGMEIFTPAGTGFQSFTASGTFVVPPNIYYLTAKMFAGGGGGGGGGGSSFIGTAGSAGGDSWILSASNNARGGLGGAPGGGGIGAGGAGAAGFGQVLSSKKNQYGSIAGGTGGGGSSSTGGTGGSVLGTRLPMTSYERTVSASGGAGGTSAPGTGGGAGASNTGQAGGAGGGGHAGSTGGGGGGSGAMGEYAEVGVDVKPGQSVTVTVGAGGAGGGGGGGTSVGGGGGNGGTGLVIIHY